MFKHKLCARCGAKNHSKNKHCKNCGELLPEVTKISIEFVVITIVFAIIVSTALAKEPITKKLFQKSNENPSSITTTKIAKPQEPSIIESTNQNQGSPQAKPKSSQPSSQNKPQTPKTIDYTPHYQNILNYFSQADTCYSKAISEAKSGNFVAMNATVSECTSIVEVKVDSELYADGYQQHQRAVSNLGSANGYYKYAFNSMWGLESSYKYPDSFASDLARLESTIQKAHDYIQGAKNEWNK